MTTEAKLKDFLRKNPAQNSFGQPQGMKALEFKPCEALPEDAKVFDTWSNWTIGSDERGRSDAWGVLYTSSSGVYKTHSRLGDAAWGVPAWDKRTFICTNLLPDGLLIE